MALKQLVVELESVMIEAQFGEQPQGSQPAAVNSQASDSAKVEDTFHIDVFQSGGLIAFTRKLAAYTAQSVDPHDEACFATATILMAAAALEALLSEYAYTARRTSCTKDFRMAGVPKKFKLLTGEDLAVAYPDVAELWDHRIAIGHSEPESARSRFYGTRINKAGAIWAADVVAALAWALWDSSMPDWFRNDAGL
jgi:hypothetical protein